MKLKVTFLPEGAEIPALPDNTLLDLAREAGLDLAAQCGGGGTCGKCLVMVDPAPEPTAADEKHVSREKLDRGFRLACRTTVGEKDRAVFVPPESRVFNLKALTAGRTREVPLDPGIRKRFLSLEAPTIEDQAPDWPRVAGAIAAGTGRPPGAVACGLPLLRKLPRILRESGFRVTVTLAGDTVIDVEPGDTTGQCCGVAFDLGSTTIVGALIDIATARELAVTGRGNPQAQFGSDVVNRISHTIENPGGGEEIGAATCAALNEIIDRLCRRAGIARENIYQATIAGNSVMEHLLLRIPASSLAASPYNGVYRDAVTVSASELELDINGGAPVFLAPLISGYVGGDTVAGILSTNQHRERALRLFIDIGTNGEIVIGNNRELWCAAAAAGPAFEGACIRHGMRSEAGAIDKVRLHGDRVDYTTVGEKPARGICGTGLIEVTAELLRAGLVTPEGHLLSGKEVAGRPEAGDGRLRTVEGEQCFVIDRESGVAVFQKDIRQLQLAKGAIAAAIAILLEKAQLEIDDVDEVFLAGAFGSYIDPGSALRIGLLPPVPPQKIRFLGNTALAGAKLMLVSGEMQREAGEIPALCRYVELFHEPGFMNLFVERMIFPPQAPGGPGPGSR